MRGATTATAGSPNCSRSGSSQPGRGRQSASRNATSDVSTSARPVLRAAAGPPFVARRTHATLVSCVVFAGTTTGWALASSTTMMLATWPMPLSNPGSSSPRTGTTTVTSPAVNGVVAGTGCRRPPSRRRRTSDVAPLPGGTGLPFNKSSTRSAPFSLMRTMRSGEPPSSTVPRSLRCIEGSATTKRPASSLVIEETLCRW